MGEIRDAVEVLIEDHCYMEVLLEQFDLEDDPAELRRLFMRIAGELAAHEAAEQDVVSARAAVARPGRQVVGPNVPRRLRRPLTEQRA